MKRPTAPGTSIPRTLGALRSAESRDRLAAWLDDRPGADGADAVRNLLSTVGTRA